MLKVTKSGNNYIMIISACDMDNLRRALSDVNIKNIFSGFDSIDIYRYITELLHNMGIPSNVKGYKYVNDMLIYLYENDLECNICDIYKIIANKYNTKAINIEQSIRHAIEKSFNRGDIEFQQQLFGFSVDPEKATPTNKEYICTLLGKLYMDFNKY